MRRGRGWFAPKDGGYSAVGPDRPHGPPPTGRGSVSPAQTLIVLPRVPPDCWPVCEYGVECPHEWRVIEPAEVHEHDMAGCLDCECIAGPPYPRVPCTCPSGVRSDVRP